MRAAPFSPRAATSTGGSGRVRGVTGADGSEGTLVPLEFVAVTVKVYGVPLVRPEKAQLVVVASVVQTWPPGWPVIVYPVIELPPWSAGACQVTLAAPSPGVPTTSVGRSGSRPEGVTEFEGSEAGPSPTEFVAMTVKVYGMPLVRPVTTQLVAGATAVQVRPSGEEVAVYEVGAGAPLGAGAVQLTSAAALPAAAVTAVGGPGGEVRVTSALAEGPGFRAVSTALTW